MALIEAAFMCKKDVAQRQFVQLLQFGSKIVQSSRSSQGKNVLKGIKVESFKRITYRIKIYRKT